ncbi:YdcF family protein [Arthrobacter globiformis]|uniref:YdcF family protein n=1 Tax=Arthrobacter globiformis TaxID=1665 RepID=UPI00278526CD|nr:ElyC/SanA/YdcF family protein [Arthrobacter globiformis]MDQ0865767.1 uncharacterized SAM-binding protein YcdF (DUF218 family) [Arthrobacter globiformis]
MPLSAPKTLSILRRSAAAATAVFVLWLVIAYQLFVNVDPLVLHRTDAVIMLGGAGAERLPLARQTQQDLGIPVLVLSHTDTPGNAAADDVCNSTTFPSRSLICFHPDGYDTRGEAQKIADLVTQNGWTSITVVTSSYHVARAERLLEQCTTAEVQMVASHPGFLPSEWLQRFVLESVGLVDVSLRPECRQDAP